MKGVNLAYTEAELTDKHDITIHYIWNIILDGELYPLIRA